MEIRDYTGENIGNRDILLEFSDSFKENMRLLKKVKKHIENYENIYLLNGNTDIKVALKAMLIEDKRKRDEFIYDALCEILDRKWEAENPCKFCNNRCISSRNNYMDKEYDGCCYSFKRKYLGKVEKNRCKYLGENKKCLTKNISCKLFTCDYLKKNTNFDTSYDNYYTLNIFYNKKEKLILKYNFFRSREEVLDKLSEKSFLPYVLYLLKMDYYIM